MKRRSINNWITASAVAEMHDMSRSLLLYYVKKGTGPEGEQIGRNWVFPFEEAQRWEKPEPEKRGPRHDR